MRRKALWIMLCKSSLSKFEHLHRWIVFHHYTGTATVIYSADCCFRTTLLRRSLLSLDINKSITGLMTLKKFLQMAASADTERTILDALRYKHNHAKSWLSNTWRTVWRTLCILEIFSSPYCQSNWKEPQLIFNFDYFCFVAATKFETIRSHCLEL